MWKVFRVEGYNQETLKTRLKNPNSSIPSQLKELGCVSVLIEENYIDFDFRDEFKLFYVGLFQEISRRCERLHFFSSEINIQESVGGMPPVPDFSSIPAESYLGFLVLRPTFFNTIGKTVLRASVRSDDCHLTCQADFATHLLGHEFSVRGMPFIQQDSQAGVCAQAALWMVSRYFSSRFKERETYLSEINALAKLTLPSGKLHSDKGLYTHQLLGVLQGLGYSSLLHDRSSCKAACETFMPTARGVGQQTDEDEPIDLNFGLASIALPYIDSGLPVILNASRHALVAVGYEDRLNGSNRSEVGRISSFFVNDDGRGPYCELPIITEPRHPERRANRRKVETFDDVWNIIVTVPAGVNLFAEAAEDAVVQFLQRFPSMVFGKLNSKPLADRLKGLLDQIEFRTRLVPSVDFQRSLHSEIVVGSRVATCMHRLDFPKFLWVCDLVTVEKGQKRNLGVAVVDSTSVPKMPVHVLALHIDGVLFCMNAERPSESLLEQV